MRLLSTALFRADLHTRMPAKYGIATLISAPHVFVRVMCDIDGERQTGTSADLLPPRWFTKNPNCDPEREIADMIAVIQKAQEHALAVGAASTLFEFWRAMSERQNAWARANHIPALLATFGNSLLERALIDAFCRARGETFATAIRSNSIGIDLGAMHGELAGSDASTWLPLKPARKLFARHTVALADPLTEAEILPGDRVEDGLPQSLEACIARYGLQHFKLKLGAESDLERLRAIAAVLDRAAPSDYLCSIDGNEGFRGVALFRSLWEQISADPQLDSFRERLLFVEQPFHRDITLTDEVGAQLDTWTDRPPIVIDESDAELSSLPRALQLGYAGTTHKNCKGVLKGVANACLMARRRQLSPQGRWSFTGEDLGNVGPVALLQDLAVQASLGVSTVERNGHHYFAGLSFWPKAIQERVRRHHPDLYCDSRDGWPTLRIEEGQIDVGSVCAAPFGTAFDFDPATVASRVPEPKPLWSS